MAQRDTRQRWCLVFKEFFKFLTDLLITFWTHIHFRASQTRSSLPSPGAGGRAVCFHLFSVCFLLFPSLFPRTCAGKESKQLIPTHCGQSHQTLPHPISVISNFRSHSLLNHTPCSSCSRPFILVMLLVQMWMHAKTSRIRAFYSDLFPLLTLNKKSHEKKNRAVDI